MTASRQAVKAILFKEQGLTKEEVCDIVFGEIERTPGRLKQSTDIDGKIDMMSEWVVQLCTSVVDHPDPWLRSNHVYKTQPAY